MNFTKCVCLGLVERERQTERRERKREKERERDKGRESKAHLVGLIEE